MSKQVAILGTPIHNLTMDETVDRIEAFITAGGFHQVATANTDFLVKSLKDLELRTILRRCHLVVADGMPLVWASRLVGVPLKERVTGADLVPRLAALAAAKGYRVFLLGASPESSRLAAENMERDYPGIQITRMAPPPAPLDRMDNAEILRQIHDAKPDILLVAFGNPKQEKWIDMHRASLRDVPVCIGVGASIDFMARIVARAPHWMQVTGLEWVHRLVLDPGRLGPRYFVDMVQFMRNFVVQKWTHGIIPHFSGIGTVDRQNLGTYSILRVHGELKGKLLDSFEETSSRAVRDGQDVIADLAGITAIGADAVATLINLPQNGGGTRGRVTVVGLRPHLGRLLHLASGSGQAGTDETSGQRDELLPALQAHFNVQLSDEAALCQLAGELTSETGRVISGLCRQLTDSVKDVTFDVTRLSEVSRSSLTQFRRLDEAAGELSPFDAVVAAGGRETPGLSIGGLKTA